MDDFVAAGVNAGTDVLMNRVEHIIITRSKAREYYREDETTLKLGPILGSHQEISCLEMHRRDLKGSTCIEVLEVFRREVGIRLVA